MTAVITRLFDSYEEAAKAVADLESSGIPHSAISIVSNNATASGADTTGATTADDDHTGSGTGAGTGATLGTIVGGGAGLLAGLGLLAIPGVGPVVAAGWLVATLTGAGVGAAGGGLLGSLIGAGVEESEAHVYAEGVRRGGTLVTVQADDGQRATVETILARYAGVDANARGSEYRAAGWDRFEPNAPAYQPTATTPILGTESSAIDPITGRPTTRTTGL